MKGQRKAKEMALTFPRRRLTSSAAASNSMATSMRAKPARKELTKQQFTLLCALEQNDGASQTALVEITGIDRSTLAEMVRRMLEKGLLSRERTEEDQRANAVAIRPTGRKALRAARNAADRAERALLEALPLPERQKFVKALSQIAQAAEMLNGDAAKGARRNVRRRKLGVSAPA